MLFRHNRTHLRAFVVGAADLEPPGKHPEPFDEPVGNVLLRDHDGQRHAALAGAPEGRIDDALCGSLQHRVVHDKRVVFGLAQGLHALSVCRRSSVDLQPGARGSDEADALDAAVGQKQLRGAAVCGNHAHNALRQPGFLQKLEQAHGGHGRCARGLDHDGVARRDAERHHPAHGDHRGKIEGGDSGEYADRLAVKHGIVAAARIHQAFAHQERRRAAGKLQRFLHLEQVAAGLLQRLSVFPGEKAGQLVHVLENQRAEAVQHLRPLERRRA